MNTKDYIPKGYSEKYTWLYNLETYVNANLTRFGVMPADLMALADQTAALGAANAAADAPNAGAADRLDRKEKAAAAAAAARAFVNQHLRFNPAVNDYDRVQMALTVPDKHPTHVPVPATFPAVEIETPAPATVRVHYFDSANTDSHRRAKPAGAHGAEFIWAVLDTPPGTDWSLLTRSAFDTATPCDFTFAGNERGRHLYFATRWENTRGEKGPLSAIYDAIIP